MEIDTTVARIQRAFVIQVDDPHTEYCNVGAKPLDVSSQRRDTEGWDMAQLACPNIQ
jgi:hypothetical protein